MTVNLKESKNKVNEDWQNAFPQLSKYSKNKFYKVVDPIITGIELIKLPRTEEYRPHFVMYPLWKKDIAGCLDQPIILKEFYNNQGLQYSIPYEKHDVYFNDVLENVNKQLPISFEGDMLLGKLLTEIDKYSNTPPLNASYNSFLQAKLQESKFKIALFVSVESAQNILEEINGRNWDADHFKIWSKNVSDWTQSLQEKVRKRDAFLKQIEINKQDKKIMQLKNSMVMG